MSLTSAAFNLASPFKYVRKRLTHAQTLILPTTPFLLLPAPGANKIIIPILTTYFADTTAGIYTNISAWSGTTVFNGTLYLAYDASNNFNDASGAIIAAQLLGSQAGGAGRKTSTVGHISGNLSSITLNNDNTGAGIDTGASGTVNTGYENSDLSIVGQDSNGNWTGGNAANYMIVTCWYGIMDISNH